MARYNPIPLATAILSAVWLNIAPAADGELEKNFAAPGKSAQGEKDNLAAIFAEAARQNSRKRPDLNRNRGRIVFEARDGTYLKGEHFGRWNWPEFSPDRWGMYEVEITYVSVAPKMGFQFYIGDAKAKGYVPQSGGMEVENTASISRIYIPHTKPAAVGVLSGENTNGSTFKLRKITLTPAPEGDKVNQGIDGEIILAASTATTFSKRMRYEPKKEKNCLGFWTDQEDFAEWAFNVHSAGKFQLQVVQGCGTGNGGSEVGLWLNDKQHKFTVQETGGFQNWKSLDLGTVELEEGANSLTIKPLSKTNKAVMDVHKVLLKPVE